MNKIDKAKNYVLLDNKFFVYKRPHLDEFLDTVSEFCDISIYTASIKEYADKVINYIDKNRVISKRYYRSDCVNISNNWYKDVSKYCHDNRRLIIIDDLPQCHLHYKSNILYII